MGKRVKIEMKERETEGVRENEIEREREERGQR